MASVTAPPLTVQGDLFGGGQPDMGALDELVRIPLTDGAWIDHAPRWLQGHDDLFDLLVRTLPWEANRRPMYEREVDVPRLTAWCRIDDPVVPAVLGRVALTLGGHYGEHFTTAGANLYRDGADSVAWHGDRIGRVRQMSVIPLVSLGEPRPFLLKPAAGGPSRRFELGRGDLLVMGGTCQVTWRHCVPKVARAAPRLSVALRSAETAEATEASTPPRYAPAVSSPGDSVPLDSQPPPSTTSSSPFT